MTSDHPYHNRPARSFWRSAIAETHFCDLQNLWQPLDLTPAHSVATAGSCFAQHIGNYLAARGANYLDLEPAPPLFETPSEARRFGYGVFSCRYGNIYTARQLLQLFDEAFGNRAPQNIVWERGKRFYDALRPGVDPVGHDRPDTMRLLRQQHLAQVRRMFQELDVFVFTMGLTEAWQSTADGTIYPSAPGTIAGQFDPTQHVFVNFRHAQVLEDMEMFWQRLKAVNPSARMLLTVSPVPLTATASDDHVLVATTYSKAVLRSVAGDMSESHDDIFYFPSYEIITSPSNKGFFFNPDQRTINPAGVEYVMRHFFSGIIEKNFSRSDNLDRENIEIMCEEERIDSAHSTSG